MLPSSMALCLLVLITYVIAEQQAFIYSFRNEKLSHTAKDFNTTQLLKLASMTNLGHMNEVLDNICIPRAVGTPNHKKVRNYLKDSLRALDWTVETDEFLDKTPSLIELKFENIIAKLNPNARRYLVLACHYDSLNLTDFVGAIDSAVPCAQLLNLATVMKKELESAKTSNVSLMMIFFDGEEAFVRWQENDSLYGSRHLAKKWESSTRTIGYESGISELDRIDLFILLDLIGQTVMEIYNYSLKTTVQYDMFVQIEQNLARLQKFNNYPYENDSTVYFKTYPKHVYYFVEDDHVPFDRRNVPVIHIIPYKFPKVWHTLADNRNNIDFNVTENLNKILRIFVASYLHLQV